MLTLQKGFAASIVLAALMLFQQSVLAESQSLSDAEIKKTLIERSIAGYPGNCPCPYNTDKAGRSCGKRSAYSKPGGYAPLCYPDDVTAEMVVQYRKKHQ